LLAEIDQLQNLTELDIGGNQLRILSDKITGLKKLEWLYLEGNNFKANHIEQLQEAMHWYEIYD